MVKFEFQICNLKTLLTIAIILNCIYLVHSHRTKRKVVFTKNSKMFFRLNGKDNVIPWTQIFAHGWTFRVNWDLPESIPRRHEFFKRDIHDELRDLDSIREMKPYSCVIKYFCELVRKLNSSEVCGVMCEIGKIIGRSEGVDSKFFRSIIGKCNYYSDRCPYTFSHASSHTDL